MGYGSTAVMRSARGVRHGCNIGPLDTLGYSVGGVNIIAEFKAALPVPGARIGAFIDDITVPLAPELAFYMETRMAAERGHNTQQE